MNKKKQTKNMLMDMTIEEQLLKIQEMQLNLKTAVLDSRRRLQNMKKVYVLFAGVQVKSTECKNALQS